MKQFKFHFDQKNCIGCRACQIACKDKNNLPLGTNIRVVTEQEMFENGRLEVLFYSYAYPFQENNMAIDHSCLKACNTCADLRRKGQRPACEEACVTNCLILIEEEK